MSVLVCSLSCVVGDRIVLFSVVPSSPSLLGQCSLAWGFLRRVSCVMSGVAPVLSVRCVQRVGFLPPRSSWCPCDQYRLQRQSDSLAPLSPLAVGLLRFAVHCLGYQFQSSPRLVVLPLAWGVVRWFALVFPVLHLSLWLLPADGLYVRLGLILL